MGNVKDFFKKVAQAASVYLDPYGESELKRMELADKKLDLENKKNSMPFDFGGVSRKDDLSIFGHEISHAIDPGRPVQSQNPPKNFNIPKPKSNIGILPPDAEPPVAQAPEVTPAQRTSQVATVMAGGTQGKLRAPQTARFQRKTL